LIEIAVAIKNKRKPTALFYISTVASVVFGVLDLSLQNAFFFKFESVLTNFVTGIFFLGTLWAEESAILSFVKAKDPTRVITGKTIFRTHLLTVIWAVYYFIKAGIYYWMTTHYSEIEAAAFRAGFGSISFYVLLALSITQSRKVFDFLEEKRILVTPDRFLFEST